MTPQLPVNAVPVLANTIDKLSEHYRKYVETGVYEHINLDPLSHEGQTRRFFRHCARELKRPFVHKSEWGVWTLQKAGGHAYQTTGVYLYFPKQRRLEPLYAPFLLVSSKNASRYGVTESRYSIGYRIVEFWIRDADGGTELYQHMLTRIRTNPALRSIFNIPDEVR